MGDVAEKLKLEESHGKEKVRVARVWRRSDGHTYFVEWEVSVNLLSDCLSAYTTGDNSAIVATDTIKNTVYVKAKECSELLSLEEFAIKLSLHFTTFYPQVTTAVVKINEKPWKRVYVDDQPHGHGFQLGTEKHTTKVVVYKSGEVQLISGIEGLSLLKTTKSGFEGFMKDKYTILPDTQERILATEVDASWRYCFGSVPSIPQKGAYFVEQYTNIRETLLGTFFGPPKEGIYSPSVQRTLFQMADAILSRFPDVTSVRLKMPNIHFLPVNLSNKDHGIIMKFEDDVYLPTDEPHGSIEASLSRRTSKL